MKKAIPIILLVSLLLVGCGKPYDKAVDNALKVLDQYENLEITSDEASAKLEQLAETIEPYTDESNNDKTYDYIDYSNLESKIRVYAMSFRYDPASINLEIAKKDFRKF